jgi:hypothetical protein
MRQQDRPETPEDGGTRGSPQDGSSVSLSKLFQRLVKWFKKFK